MKKTTLIAVGMIVLLAVVAAAVLLSGGEKEGSPDNQSNQQEQNNTSQPQGSSGDEDQEASATGEIIGQIDMNGIPIPEFSVMEEVATNQKEGDNFSAIYSINAPEEGAIKDFYRDNLDEDWSLEEEQTSGGQTVYIFSKGENYNLKVAITEDGTGSSGQGAHGMAIDYTAPYQEDPYPDAVGVAPTSDKAEEFHEDFSSVFEDIFGGVKLNDTNTGDWIKFNYIVKRPITQEDATEIRSQ
ncbi:MAG TPA: hypothetical protein VKO42_00090, partial [Patescibacteria group bacterium]|nr:hypothetical protein [Patescibacteria group bacterium]